MVILKTIQQALNDLASTTGLTAQEAANVFADTTGLSVQDALAVVSGKGKLLRQESANDLALESGLTLQEALNTLLAQSNYNVKGGVERVIDSATGDIARTTSGWIEDEKYGLGLSSSASAVSAEFDTAVTITGLKTLKLSHTNTSGNALVATLGTSGASLSEATVKKYGIPIKPSTAYIFKCKVKTINAAADAVFLGLHQHNSTGTRLVASVSSKLTGDNDTTELSVSITTNASAAYANLIFANSIAGNISDAWFDVNSMTLEEVTTINNTSGSPAYLYQKGIAVSSTDNIDQSQVVSDTSGNVGSVNRKARGQQIIPTKKHLTGIVMRRDTSVGTYTGDVIFTLRTDNGSDRPSETILETITIPNATWEAITADTDFTVPFSQTLIVGNKYWVITTSSTTADDTNYTKIRSQATGTYAGVCVFRNDNDTWSITTNDLYFKTLYSKNTTNFTVRTDTEEVSVTAPTPEGWEDGTVVNIPGSLELATGSNNLYLSSNGANEASGDTDSSLQGIIRVTKRLS